MLHFSAVSRGNPIDAYERQRRAHASDGLAWVPRRLLAILALCFIVAAGCARAPAGAGVDLSPTGRHVHLFDAETAITDEWFHLPLHRRATEYRLASVDGEVCIRAVGRASASALIRRVRAPVATCPVLEWSWGVERLQPSADLTVRELEDVAASIFLLFGDPGFLHDPEPVPTLRYVWTNGRHVPDAIIDNPYLPGKVQSIVVRSGGGRTGEWVTETRHVVSDFQRAFGYVPKEDIYAVAVFTDNDQTEEPVEAYYGWARLVCR